MKKIYDSVHGFISYDDFERQVIDSIPFQRLRYIRQLGIAYLIYPGATHSRFEHSLGTMELATRIFDQITSSTKYIKQKPDFEYWRKIVRLAALCHDLGHLPFSHVAESAIFGNKGHELWTLKIIESSNLKSLWKKLQSKYPKQDVLSDLIKIALGEKTLKHLRPRDELCNFSNWERVVAQIIAGDFFGADRIDYLLRDAKCTGVAYGLFDYQQLIETLRILPALNEEGLELGIDENGIESCEALLLARHFMYRRVYQVSSVKSYSFHIARFMQGYLRDKLNDLEGFLKFSDHEILTALYEIAKDPKHPLYLDAHCFINRKSRFKAVQIPVKFTIKQIESIQKKLKIPDELFAWKLTKEHNKARKLHFPVIDRNQEISDASNFSQISIPSRTNSWVYIAPDHEQKFLICSK